MSTTIKDVALEAGVGVGTVSRVINDTGSVNPKTKKIVEDAINKLNYVPSSIGVRLRTKKTKTIALLIPVITDLFFAKLVQYVEQELDKYNYSLIVVSSQQRISKELEIIDKLKRKEVDGALIVTHYQHDESDLENCNIVSIDRHLGNSIPYVTSSNYESSKKAIEYLIARGCKKIGFIGSKPLVESEVSLREKAYDEIIQKYNLNSYKVNEVINHGEENKIVDDFFDKYKEIDGLFVSGFTLSQTVYKKIQQLHIDLPNQLQLISFDENFVDWIINLPDITCVTQDIQELAKQSVSILIDKIDGKKVPSKTIIKTNFKKGFTTK